MRVEIWRLYRHLIITGGIIAICCYIAMMLFERRINTIRIEQLLCVDAHVSSTMLLSGIEFDANLSQFSWTLHTSEPSVAQAMQNIHTHQLIAHLENSYRSIVGLEEAPLVEGELNSVKSILYLESLLLKLLNSSELSYAQKLDLLNKIPCVTVSLLETQTPDGVMNATLSSGASAGEGAFIWSSEGVSHLVSVEIYHPGISFKYMVVFVVVIALLAMLLVIWRELLILDRKRQSFESITREIARGRSAVTEEVADSSGTLRELAYSFDSMSSHIQRLLKVQREMINAISHELRTPIARLRFGLEVLKDDVDEAAITTIDGLEGDVEELNTLVDEVLTYGKLEDGSLALHFASVSIYHIVEEILEHNKTLLQHLILEVNVPEDVNVNADEHHLRRALQNLILNASKYASSKISISFTLDEERWQLDIEDDGPGIPFEDRDKVFIPFHRLDNSRTRASGGYGLGLAIVQRIAFWHGGAVLIDESESGGAKFSLIWSRKQHQNSVS